MSTVHEKIATLGDVQSFGTHGMEELGHLVLDEREARLGMLVVMASGSNGVFIGEPGGGKTTLAESSNRLVDGISRDRLAIIPPVADLKPRQLVGGNSVVTRTVDGIDEVISTETHPIMNTDTQVIWADEINRGAPHAINSLLGALASRKFSNTAGEVDLVDLEYAISTMNPGGLNEGVFKINPANASRHAVGALMGADKSDEETQELIDGLLAGWRSNPEKMSSIVDLETLHAIRNYVTSDKIAFSESLRSDSAAKIINTRQVLHDYRVQEALPRLTLHIAQNAKTIAALKGENAVDPESVDQAIKFVVGGRLGMRSTDAEAEIPQAIDKILS